MIAALLAGDEKAGLIAERVAEALGLGGAGGGTSEETFWAVRRLFEALARAGPLVIVVDDLHWAEATFLDLIEHVADLSRDCPILLVCVARPELLEKRPGWAAGRPNATSILLEPLNDAECRELISNLLGGAPLPAAAASRIADAAEGNAALRRGARGDARRRAAPHARARPLGRRVRPRRAAGALDDQRPSRRPCRGPPGRRARDPDGRGRRGRRYSTGAPSASSPASRSTQLEDGLQALVRRDLIRPETPTSPARRPTASVTS